MIIVLIGRSGCGKTAIAGILQKRHGFEKMKTCTTRKRREGEPLGAYHFLSEEGFQEKMSQGAFIETDKYGDNWYGALRTSFKEDGDIVAVLTPEGARKVKEAFPQAFVVHVDADMKTCVQRAIAREDKLTPDKLKKITDRALPDYYLYDSPDCDYEVHNSDGASLEVLADEIVRMAAAYGECLVPPLTFRLYQRIRFNRPIDRDNDYISPGGYEVTMRDENGKETDIQFDFEDYEGSIDDDDPCILNCMQKNPDFNSFEDLDQVTEHMMRNITKILEWYIYTGEAGESDLMPVEILEPCFEVISDSSCKEIPIRKIKIRGSIALKDGEPEN